MLRSEVERVDKGLEPVNQVKHNDYHTADREKEVNHSYYHTADRKDGTEQNTMTITKLTARKKPSKAQ